MYRSICTYWWDVADQAPEKVAEEFGGLGLNTISLASSYHAGKFIRPHGGGGPRVIFPEDGTVYFPPRLDRYGPIRPRAAAILDGVDPFERLAGHGLSLTAWTVLLHNTRLGMAHPEAVARNAFGDPYWYSLCPCHPQVREYAVTLCSDLADGRPVDGISIETPGWLPYQHGFHHEFAQVEANGWLFTLLGLCFCASCAEGARRAGLDLEPLRRRVAGRIDSFLASDVVLTPEMASEWLIADLVAEPDMAAFLRWRSSVVTSLVAEIRAAVRQDVEVSVIPSIQRPSAACWSEGTDHAAIAGVADGLDVPIYEPTPQRALADYWDVRRRAGGDAKIRCVLRPGPPDMRTCEQAVETVGALARAGVTEFSFYNYGLLRRHNLQWMKAALSSIEMEHRS